MSYFFRPLSYYCPLRLSVLQRRRHHACDAFHLSVGSDVSPSTPPYHRRLIGSVLPVIRCVSFGNQSLDVDYVLVIFGGVTGYSSDDINKFLWPVRIGSGVFQDDMHHEKVRPARPDSVPRRDMESSGPWSGVCVEMVLPRRLRRVRRCLGACLMLR